MRRTISLLALSLFCAPHLAAEQTTSYGYHLHTSPVKGFSHFIQMLEALKQTGGTAARIDTNWQNFQSQPKIAFDPSAIKVKPAQYLRYLRDRGYGENGKNLYEAYHDLHNSYLLGLKSIFNFGEPIMPMTTDNRALPVPGSRYACTGCSESIHRSHTSDHAAAHRAVRRRDDGSRPRWAGTDR